MRSFITNASPTSVHVGQKRHIISQSSAYSLLVINSDAKICFFNENGGAAIVS